MIDGRKLGPRDIGKLPGEQLTFIDTEKLHGINIFYNNNKMSNRKIDIITLKENKGKIEEILTNKVNIIEIDDLLGGIYGEIKKV